VLGYVGELIIEASCDFLRVGFRFCFEGDGSVRLDL